MAAETLEALLDLCERYPDAREEITCAVGGPDALAVLPEARRILRSGADTPPTTAEAQ